MYDVIIVGAGPAGSTAALYAHRLGLNCILLDKAVFPRDKICGDALSGKSVRLMRELNDAIMDTRNELLDSGHWDSTIILTTSEFGRRLMENKSRGTDHGTAAPHFIIGGNIRGGLFGKAPNLSKLGTNQDIKSTMDYRAVYNSIIEDYFGVRSKFKTYGDPRLKSLFPGNVKASQV